jgi:uncharacterized caspase-like protein
MGKHWVIAIGISQYQWLTQLPYAANDTNVFSSWFRNSSSVGRVYHLADTCSEVIVDGGAALPGQPTYANIKQFLQLRFSTPFLEPDDVLWFLFSGHGLQFVDRDYLMCADSNPMQADQTAIAVNDLVSCLKRGGTEQIVLLLDACHTQAQPFGQGFGTDPEGAIVIFGSHYGQVSQGIDQVQQGLFTYAFLETLRSVNSTRSDNLEELYSGLCNQMTHLSGNYALAPQTPRLRIPASLTLNSISTPQPDDRSIEILAPLLAKQRMEELTLKSMLW